jgi:hypothetical protein
MNYGIFECVPEATYIGQVVLTNSIINTGKVPQLQEAMESL